MAHLKPDEILKVTENSAVSKGNLPIGKTFLLAIMAGAFIALAGAGASMVNYSFMGNPSTIGIGRGIGGLIFSAGLLMVVLAGGELFTGNSLMVTGLIKKKISILHILKNWIVVYIGNFLGSVIVAWMMNYSGLFNTGNGALSQVVINTAVSKVSLGFGQAVILGILCNFLVCIAVWMSNGADSTIGKIFCIFFPIWLFVTCGFEHSVANMYFIPAGIFAAITTGADAGLTISSFFLGNLLPVTIGNIIGGFICVGLAYSYTYKKD